MLHLHNSSGVLTAKHAIRVTSHSFNFLALSTNPGKCIPEQVGVNALGTVNRTTQSPDNSFRVENFSRALALMLRDNSMSTTVFPIFTVSL